MAEKRYSSADQEKMKRDFLADCRAKGCDFQEMHSTSPDGIQGSIKEMKADLPFTKDQSQAWTEHNKEKLKNKND
jgi:hypothetical protein